MCIGYCILEICVFFWSLLFSIDKLIESVEIMFGVNNVYNCIIFNGYREMNKKKVGNKSYIRNI